MKPRFSPESILGTTLSGTRRYRLEQVISSGVLAHVYLAATESGERVAVKLLRPEAEHKREVVARFEREALAASRLRHENVVRVFEPAQRAGAFYFFATEHLVGVDLADLLASQGRLHPTRAVRIALGAAAGLQAAHAAGVVHRDVKPENLFLVHNPDGREEVKVLDFGSASLLGSPAPAFDQRITMTTGFVGTPGYMAPEQADRAEGHPTADVYALGVVLYEALTGHPPFAGKSWVELVTKHAQDPVPIPGGLSPELAAVLSRSMAKTPEPRFGSMREVIQALGAVGELRLRSDTERSLHSPKEP